MPGFRETFNISFNQDAMGVVNATDGASVQCGSEDDVETSALLVGQLHMLMLQLHAFAVHVTLVCTAFRGPLYQYSPSVLWWVPWYQDCCPTWLGGE